MISLPLVSLLLAASPTAAPAAGPGSVLETLHQLTDRVGPRLSGSAGDKRGVAWAQARMKALGLANVRAEPVRVPHWERGSESGELTAPVRQRLVIAALGGSAGTSPRGVEGEVVRVGSLAELEALAPEKVKGRIVFIDQQMEANKPGAGYGALGGNRMRGPSVAAKKGALAAVIRSLGTSGSRFAHTGMTRFEPGQRAIPAAALSTPDAAMVARLIEGGQPVRLKLTLGCRTLPDAMSANVIGEVVGSEKPEEIVVIGAHLDSWDLGPGAQDNGVGVSVVMHAAQALLGGPVKPRRTVRVVLFANEENGGRGGDEYARAHAAEVKLHQAAFVLDAGAGRSKGLAYLGGPGAAEAFAPVHQAMVAAVGPGELSTRTYAHPDVRPLYLLGVPLYALDQDSTHYFDVHHTADDVPEHVTPEALQHLVDATAAATLAVANLPELLARVPPQPQKAPAPPPAAAPKAAAPPVNP